MKLYPFLLLLTTLLPLSAETSATCDCSSKPISRLSVIKGELLTLHYITAGMSCGSCEKSITQKLSTLDGVTVESVDSKNGHLKLTYTAGKSTPVDVLTTIKDAGFIVTGELISIKVAGMSCASCEKDFTKKLEQIDGILAVNTVDHKSGVVTYTTPPDSCKGTLKKAIDQTGYKVISDTK